LRPQSYYSNERWSYYRWRDEEESEVWYLWKEICVLSLLGPQDQSMDVKWFLGV
jgi:hypothetical protein